MTLAAYDLPYPEPLHSVRPIEALFGMALVLVPAPTARTTARLNITPGRSEMAATVMDDADLEHLRIGNPAARGLPLLAALAAGKAATVCINADMGVSAHIRIEPA